MVTRPDYSSLDLPPPPAGRPYVLMNMVMSADGKVVIDGTEQGIGSKADQRLMRELRVNADIVLNGASTLRASGTSSRLGDAALEELRISRGKSRSPVAATLSASGDLPLDRLFFTARDFEAVVYLSERAPAEKRAAIEATGRPVVVLPAGGDIQAMLGHMRHELGAQVLLAEGGPTVNAQLFELGCVDEYFLTLGPVIVAGRDTLTAVEGARAFGRENVKRLELVTAAPNTETGEVYLRYRVRPPAS
jgi:2,5-diamino-6-(ribosylamino)-4(3H)-pyrimidinone 5'-phosphate reductase